MTTTATATATAVPVMVLTPPDEVVPVSAKQTTGLVALPDEAKTRVEQQADTFIASLRSADVNSDEFRKQLDAAFSLGRKEIATATMQSNAFTKGNFAKEAGTPAYEAISQMRTVFDELNPAKQGDLFSATRVMGIPVPWGNKLAAYLRRYESAERQLGKLHEDIEAAKDLIGRDVTELGLVRQRLWDGILSLQKVVHFVDVLDRKLSSEIETVRLTDEPRARALEQEVLYYVRQNLEDVQAAQALAINAYNVAGELRKTGRETMNACDRMATLGMSALSVAVMLARATGRQMKTMEMLVASKKSVEDLIVATGQGLKSHVEMTTKFASDPVLGVAALQKMFDSTFEAMDIMDNYRRNALGTMRTNIDMLSDMNSKQMARIEHEQRAAGAAEGIVL